MQCTHLRDLPRELILKVFQLALLPELVLYGFIVAEEKGYFVCL